MTLGYCGKLDDQAVAAADTAGVPLAEELNSVHRVEIPPEAAELSLYHAAWAAASRQSGDEIDLGLNVASCRQHRASA